MYMDKGLNLSTSVPIFSNGPQRVTQSYLRYPNNTLESNSFRSANQNKAQNSSFESKKMESSQTFSTQFQPNQSFQNKRYNIAQSQIQNQTNQTYKFQFKRNTMNNSRPAFKQDPLNHQNNQLRNSEGQQPFGNYNQLQYGPSVNQRNFNNNPAQNKKNEKQFRRSEQYQKQIKDLQNQLKFEQKYANDLYKTSQQAKKQASTIKAENQKLQKQKMSLQSKNEQLTQSLEEIKKLHVRQIEATSQLNAILNEKNQKIQLLQGNQSNNKMEIQRLNQKISNFTAYYRNELYEQRIKQLNQQLINTNASLAQSLIEKNQLVEELKGKNQKILCMSINSPTKNKEPLIKTINVSQRTNEAISIAFEESIKVHQKDIQDLKNIIEQKNQEYRRLQQDMIELKKVIEGMKQEAKVTALKANAEKNQILQQKDRDLTQKSNEIKTLMNRLNMIEQRYSKALKEINEKDMFLQEHLVGRAKDLETKSYVEKIMQEYIQTFESRFSLEEKIKALQKQLAAYKQE